MKASHIKQVEKDSKNWITFFFLGVIFFAIGFYSLFYPFAKTVSISRVFGTLAFLTGILKLTFINKHRLEVSHWKRHILMGVSDIFIAICLFNFQGFSMYFLPFIVSFWILSGGIALMEEIAGIEVFHIPDTDWMIAGGLITIVAFFAAAYLPELGSLAVMLSTSFFLFATGGFYIVLSWKLKSLRRSFKNKDKHLLNRR